jgi:hypothetical protein
VRTVTVVAETLSTVEITQPPIDATGVITLAMGAPVLLHAQTNFPADAFAWQLFVKDTVLSLPSGNDISWDPASSVNVGCHALPAVLRVTASNSVQGDIDDIAIWIYPPFFGSNCIH